jgi:hypothetical protein
MARADVVDGETRRLDDDEHLNHWAFPSTYFSKKSRCVCGSSQVHLAHFGVVFADESMSIAFITKA